MHEIASFSLSFAERKKAERVTHEKAIEQLEGWAKYDTVVGPAAKTALGCVETHNADPRMLLAVLEIMIDGGYWRRNAGQMNDATRGA